jgi:hypothetical protein
MGDAPIALGREVLPERPAERDVEDLQATADAEDGRPDPGRPLDEREVERVPLRPRRHGFVHLRLAVPRRVDVRPARDEQAVEGLGKGIPRLHDQDLLVARAGGEEGVAVGRKRLRGVDGEDDLHLEGWADPAAGAGGGGV